MPDTVGVKVSCEMREQSGIVDFKRQHSLLGINDTGVHLTSPGNLKSAKNQLGLILTQWFFEFTKSQVLLNK